LVFQCADDGLHAGERPDGGETPSAHVERARRSSRSGRVFGSTTETSVTHYQQNENLTVDGIVGKQTWTSLLSKWLLQSEPG
jgi:murein L,D-transpeptidase YcbB/YkuD